MSRDTETVQSTDRRSWKGLIAQPLVIAAFLIGIVIWLLNADLSKTCLLYTSPSPRD